MLVGRSDLYEPVLIGEIQTNFRPSDTIHLAIQSCGIPPRLQLSATCWRKVSSAQSTDELRLACLPTGA